MELVAKPDQHVANPYHSPKRRISNCPAWIDVADRQLQACPPAPGVNTIGLKTPGLTTGEVVTGATMERLRSNNRYQRHWIQERQEPPSYWIMHQGQFKVPEGLHNPGERRNNMCPSGLAEHYPL